MTQPRAHPDFWYPIAQLLVALRKLLHATAPEAFADIAREARAQLIAITALVRRYIYVLAAEIILPPPRAAKPTTEDSACAGAPRNSSASLFPLIERPAAYSGISPGEDPPSLQWALLMQAAARLAAVLSDPAPHARRLARRFGTLLTPGLRELPVPWHITRRLPPWLDVLICRLDAAARPEAWAGIAVDSS